MNVLIYSGPGVSQTAFQHTHSALRSLLSPNYSVQSIVAEALNTGIWCSSCALLVLPGGRDIQYLSSLKAANKHILQYVSSGGRFLGICAGAYYASANIEWEVGRPGKEIIGPRPLRFFPGLSRGCVYPNFEYQSESGARAVSVRDIDSSEYHGLYYNGGGEFVDAEKYPSARVLANYNDSEGNSKKVAGVLCSYGKGSAALWGVHLEYPLFAEPLSSLLGRSGVKETQRSQWENERIRLLKKTLQSLELRLPDQDGKAITRPLPQYFVCSPELGDLPSSNFSKYLSLNESESENVLIDKSDTFHIHNYSSGLIERIEKGLEPPNNELESELNGPKHIITCHLGSLRPGQLPLFIISKFFSYLYKCRVNLSLPYPSLENCGMGTLLMYGEVVTSTQTLLDNNPKMMKLLPAPLMSLATHQLSGRGRGGNVWLSPAGCLQFSLLLKVSSSPGSSPYPYLPEKSIVLIQYLMGMAVIAGCRPLIGTNSKHVRLKWPNDIYGIVDGTKKKLGGIIVTQNPLDDVTAIVIGCGTNVFNDLPSTSLSSLKGNSSEPLVMEEVAANIVSQFEKLWYRFLDAGGSFIPFLDDYLDYWMHSDEVVTITTTEPHVKARITGITADYGLLRAVPLSEEWNISPNYIDLQPDGNSFDMMAGLIKKKM